MNNWEHIFSLAINFTIASLGFMFICIGTSEVIKASKYSYRYDTADFAADDEEEEDGK